ncbi:MAG TPA: copper chaperone PCu(A)C [Corynebacterium variabile]|uniref:copper chaperone PCu(A)C n=1 Tax=Corynebacterium variabile TaxID=1727 RepID=UPI000ED2BC7D|nr:copper chaperone PCu(A)C [Corynebacterium variabile]MDN6241352.1 copper chaperone PCu(A)C [Corynebacterium variabile]MDN6478983.1 copper chaperone PCu(A)C [Corynebacterium variabile]MDN6676581.1 copper chaperone PCu(A)C [Corynebacterium variabile]MDN6844980.1 copper chaperone PCu(A)C [Corynebacterium variabile]HAJ52446.1 copper chaperone PCu(A)C [Corynebacterium variabile]
MTPSSFRLPRLLTTGALATTLALGLAACSDGDSEDAAQSTASSASTDSSTGSAEGTGAAGASGEEAEQGAVTLEDGYVGAKDSDTAMTAVFGSLTNHTDTDIHLTKVAGSMPGIYQYHEVVDGVMREMEDGMTIPANGTVEMAPGGHHIMVMDNHEDIAAGDVLTLTLTAEDGSTYELTDIPVRVQQSGHEDYDGTDMGDMDGMDGMDGMDHADH